MRFAEEIGGSVVEIENAFVRQIYAPRIGALRDGTTFTTYDRIGEVRKGRGGFVMLLVRLEDPRGRNLLPNRYDAGPLYGELPLARTEAEVRAALASRDPVEVLSTLVWVGGDRTVRVPELQGDDLRASVAVLVSSSNRWIREAAGLAAGRR